MKKFTILLTLTLLTFTVWSKENFKLTKGDRTFVINFLEQTQQTLLETVNNVDEDLWNYKPDDGSWTVAGCFEHILFAESQLTKKIMEKMIIGEANNSESLAQLDGMVIVNTTDRTRKVKTPEPFEPTGRWTTKQEMISELKRSRAALIDFVKNTKVNLRAYKSNSPVGERDAYQHLLIIGGHGLRHTMQMQEIMAQHKALANN